MDVISIPLLIITIHPIGGRGNQTRDDQTTIKNDGTADETGIRMPAVISLEQVSMIMVIRRGRIGLVGNGHREGWRRDVDLQPIENKVLSWGIIGKSAPILAEITIRKSQDIDNQWLSTGGRVHNFIFRFMSHLHDLEGYQRNLGCPKGVVL
jgi:hypothetical protein